MDKKCISCKTLIDEKAVKCIHCEAFQDWRRYFPISSVVLSMLVALISVLGITIPILINAFQSEYSKVEIRVQSCEVDKGEIRLYLLVSNKGNKPAFLAEGSIFFKLEHDVKSFRESITFISDNA